MSTRVTNKRKNRFSTLDVNSPLELYWPKRISNAGMVGTKEGQGTTICESFWDEFLIAAKAIYKMNPEADLFDAFNFIREQFLGGWAMLEDSSFIQKIDEEIEHQYQKEVRAGKW